MAGRKATWGSTAISLVLLSGCGTSNPQAGHVLDEARQAGRAASTFPAADDDYFHDMDSATAEVKGQTIDSLHSPMARSRSAGAIPLTKTKSV
jgi:hypothetical protein